MNIRRWLMLALGVAAVLLLLGRALAEGYSDYLWYDALGAGALWRMRMSAVATLKIGSAVAAGIFAFANLYAVRQSVVQLVFPRRLGNLEISEEVSGKYLMGAAIALSAVLAMLLAMPRADWTAFVLARSGRLFGQTDPYVSADLGFFVYWLPLENTLWNWALLCVFVVTVTVILLYALTPSLKWQRGGIYASMYVRRHFTIIAGVVLLMLAWSFRLEMYSLLIDGSGPDGTFTWVDHKFGISGNLLLSLVSLGAGLIVMWAGSVGQFRLASVSILSVVVLSLVAREVVPAIAQRSGPDRERVAREQPYVDTRAAYTRRAFGVDQFAKPDSLIRFASLAAAMPSVSIWDPVALVRAVDAAEGVNRRGDQIAWHSSPVGLVADVVSPSASGAPLRAGWSAVRVEAATADDRGAPVRLPFALESDTPSESEGVNIEAPLVFPGAPTFAIISDSLNHTAGTPLGSFLTRLASAWSLQDFDILSSNAVLSRPTLISRRDVRDRVARLTPFFAQGRVVQPLLVGDSLYWSVDLYSASATYPLSRHVMLGGEERSYFRHAGIAVVQASTGDISVVPDTDSLLDPVAWTWVHRLPSVFGTWNALPKGLRDQIPAAIDGLYAQANAFARYGSVAAPSTPRRIPTLDGADTNLVGNDFPMLFPSLSATGVTIPLVDESDRVRGLLVAIGGANPVVMWDSLPIDGPRWGSVLERLRSLDTAGGGARDASLAHGRVRSIPLRSGIGFLQPTYRWRPQAAPSLNRVATLVGDTAKSILPSQTAVLPLARNVPAQSPSPVALYNAMREALRRGDWAAFGRAFDALGQALQRGRTP